MITSKVGKILIALTLSCVVCPADAQSKGKGGVPLVYDVENTGSKFAAPAMPGVEALPESRELPDPLEWSNGKGKVKKFKDWSRRRNEISNEIQHYGIGTKPAVPAGAVKARMSGDTLIDRNEYAGTAQTTL